MTKIECRNDKQIQNTFFRFDFVALTFIWQLKCHIFWALWMSTFYIVNTITTVQSVPRIQCVVRMRLVKWLTNTLIHSMRYTACLSVAWERCVWYWTILTLLLAGLKSNNSIINFQFCGIKSLENLTMILCHIIIFKRICEIVATKQKKRTKYYEQQLEKSVFPLMCNFFKQIRC